MAVVYKCCYCRDAMSPIEGEWVSHSSASSECTFAPDSKHARQIVLNVAA